MKYAVSITKGNEPRPFWTKIVTTEVDAERIRRKNQRLIDKQGWDHRIAVTELAGADSAA